MNLYNPSDQQNSPIFPYICRMEREIELLAPARDKEVALAAIACGADAIYIGGPKHSARAGASVSLNDIREVVKAAHPFGVRVYVALNTLIYNDELESVNDMVHDLAKTGIDALIVQDMAVTEMDIPPLALHASTQCDIRGIEKARWLKSLGFSRIVPARELTLQETEAIHRELPDLEIEAFVHGALCVSYSGDCRASFALTGRSANRGECSQICRHRFSLYDGDGKILIKDKHLLSLRDLNRSAQLEQMLQAGVTSLKIEGRLKDASYVMETVGYYSRELDRIIANNPGVYRRSSYGRSKLNFTPDINAAFNRGFTSYFTKGHTHGGNLKMATLDTTGRIGQPIGKVVEIRRNGSISVSLDNGITLKNGDGLAWTDQSTGEHAGMRVNRVEGNVIYPAPGTKNVPRPGTELRRTADIGRERMLERADAAIRTIAVNATLRLTSNKLLILDLECERGHRASASIEIPEPETAQRPQEEQRRKALVKTGDSIYRINDLKDLVGNLFIPASFLSKLRRDALQALDTTAEATYRYPVPGKRESLDIPQGMSVDLAHGASTINDAIEQSTSTFGDTKVMNTRYCLRRELGRCLRTPEGRKWTGPLYLADASGARMRVEFDCRKCEMNLYTCRKNK